MSQALTSLRSRRWLIAGLILPALVFRAAIPGGFMPVFVAGHGFALELCPGVDSGTAGQGAQSPEHAHHHHQPEGNKIPGSHGGLCPFALSAGPALASAFDVGPAPGVSAIFILGEAPAALAISTIERAQSARGPPLPHWT